MYKSIMVFLLAALVMTSEAQAAGNEWNDSFNKAKKTLEWQVYYDHRITLYCGAAFDEKKDVALPEGFTAPKHEKRAGKIEWEHVVRLKTSGGLSRSGARGTRSAWIKGERRSGAVSARKG